MEQDSFVYSVPFDSSASKANGTLVTASHAIYIDHRGHKAPAAVVGLKLEHETISKHFINITSAVSFQIKFDIFHIQIAFFNSVQEQRIARELVHQII